MSKPEYLIREVTPADCATPLYAVIEDKGWCERILCTGCYRRDALRIAKAMKQLAVANR